jgi:hypothetical protein
MQRTSGIIQYSVSQDVFPQRFDNLASSILLEPGGSCYKIDFWPCLYDPTRPAMFEPRRLSKTKKKLKSMQGDEADAIRGWVWNMRPTLVQGDVTELVAHRMIVDFVLLPQVRECFDGDRTRIYACISRWLVEKQMQFWQNWRDEGILILEITFEEKATSKNYHTSDGRFCKCTVWPCTVLSSFCEKDCDARCLEYDNQTNALNFKGRRVRENDYLILTTLQVRPEVDLDVLWNLFTTKIDSLYGVLGCWYLQDVFNHVIWDVFHSEVWMRPSQRDDWIMRCRQGLPAILSVPENSNFDAESLSTSRDEIMEKAGQERRNEQKLLESQRVWQDMFKAGQCVHCKQWRKVESSEEPKELEFCCELIQRRCDEPCDWKLWDTGLFNDSQQPYSNLSTSNLSCAQMTTNNQVTIMNDSGNDRKSVDFHDGCRQSIESSDLASIELPRADTKPSQALIEARNASMNIMRKIHEVVEQMENDRRGLKRKDCSSSSSLFTTSFGPAGSAYNRNKLRNVTSQQHEATVCEIVELDYSSTELKVNDNAQTIKLKHDSPSKSKDRRPIMKLHDCRRIGLMKVIRRPQDKEFQQCPAEELHIDGQVQKLDIWPIGEIPDIDNPGKYRYSHLVRVKRSLRLSLVFEERDVVFEYEWSPSVNVKIGFSVSNLKHILASPRILGACGNCPARVIASMWRWAPNTQKKNSPIAHWFNKMTSIYPWKDFVRQKKKNDSTTEELADI